MSSELILAHWLSLHGLITVTCLLDGSLGFGGKESAGAALAAPGIASATNVQEAP